MDTLVNKFQIIVINNCCFFSFLFFHVREGDYDEFLCHLQGLCDLYQLSHDT